MLEEKYTTCSISSELVSDFLSYSTAIYNRSLPDIVDGLKVAQRRVICGLKDLGLTPDRPYSKVSRAEGHILGTYHPQGGCAGTIINMGQYSTMRYVLTDIHGNAGGSVQAGRSIGQMVSEDPPAAARYLEVRLTPLARELYTSQIEKGLGEWRQNYDGTRSEPVRIVPRVPGLLVTGAQGIASGYACNHLPYHLLDVISVSTAIIRNPGITDSQISSRFRHPPEPQQGGRAEKGQGFSDIIKNGKGALTYYGEWETRDDIAWGKRSKRTGIIVTRLAYGSSEKFLERVRELADADRLPGLVDAADHSGREGIEIVLVCKTRESRDQILNTLIHQATGLRHTWNVNAVAVSLDGKPVRVGVRETVMAWYGERVKYLCQKYEGEISLLREKETRLSAVLRVLDDMDRFLGIVRSGKDKDEVVDSVSKGWGFDKETSRHVIGIPISVLIRTETESVKSDCETIQSQISDLQRLCHPGADLDNHICDQMTSLRPLVGPRRSIWMTGRVSETPEDKKPEKGLGELMREEAKSLGVSTRAFNKWLKENLGHGDIKTRWSEFKKSVGGVESRGKVKTHGNSSPRKSSRSPQASRSRRSVKEADGKRAQGSGGKKPGPRVRRKSAEAPSDRGDG
jgi:DNA gyrase subunit A